MATERIRHGPSARGREKLLEKFLGRCRLILCRTDLQTSQTFRLLRPGVIVTVIDDDGKNLTLMTTARIRHHRLTGATSATTSTWSSTARRSTPSTLCSTGFSRVGHRASVLTCSSMPLITPELFGIELLLIHDQSGFGTGLSNDELLVNCSYDRHWRRHC